MKSVDQILKKIRHLANDSEVSVSLKNIDGKYFFANDSWLKAVQLERAQVIDKTDFEISPPDLAAIIRKTDLELLHKRVPVRYLRKVTRKGQEELLVAYKWIIVTANQEPFCYCTIADLYENNARVIVLGEKINEILDLKSVEWSDFSEK